jgi:hypothetical protein
VANGFMIRPVPTCHPEDVDIALDMIVMSSP